MDVIQSQIYSWLVTALPTTIPPAFSTDLVILFLISHYRYVITTAKGEQLDDFSISFFIHIQGEGKKMHAFWGYILSLVWSCSIFSKSKKKVVGREHVLTAGIWDKGGEDSVIAGII